MNLEQEKSNQKIIELIAELSELGGEEKDEQENSKKEIENSFKQKREYQNPLSYYAETDDMTSDEKKNRSSYLILKDFLLAKKLEGCSNQTIGQYYNCVFNFISTISMSDKKLCDVTTNDIRAYMNMYYDTHQINNRSLDNMRRIFSSFFDWLTEEEYLNRNPVKKIKRIKVEQTIKKPFTDEEIELLRDNCRNIRELAIIDFLLSSGVRVSELCMLNKDDIDFVNREGVVFGKGQKERTIYIDAKSKIHVEKYLKTRNDDNPSLFVSKRYPYKRLQKSGVEILLKEIGLRAGVDNVHPHRFRRTLATNLINKSVPIEQVQQILGHTKLDTTLIYAIVNKENVKLNHRRFV